MSAPADLASQGLARRSLSLETVLRWLDPLFLPLAALLAGMLLFAVFLLLIGTSPIEFYTLVYKAGFGTSFSWTNTLARAAPLLLAALCVALPARLGLVVIGGEGAIVLGGVGAGAVAMLAPGMPGPVGILAMMIAGALVGAIWIGGIGALRHFRGVNETISSLLLAYIAIALMNHLVEGPLRDPASLNKPSTAPLPELYRIGEIPGIGVHLCLVPRVVVDVPARCPRGSKSDPLPDAPLFCVRCARGRHARNHLHVLGRLPPLATFPIFAARFPKERDHRSSSHEDVVVV